MILPPGINLLNYGWKEMPGVIIFCNLKVEEYIILISFIISSSTLGYRIIRVNRICSKIEYEQQNDPWNVERFLEDLLLVVKGQSNLDIDGYL